MRSLKITRPTLSLLVIAENASTAASATAADGRASSGNGYAVEDASHHLVAVDLLRLRLVGDDHAVAEHVGADRLHVLRRHVAAALRNACAFAASVRYSVARGDAPYST